VPLGLCHCREAGKTLVWDDQQRIYLLDRRGADIAQRELSAALASAAAADDGSAFVAGTKAGQLSWFSADLSTTWERTLDHSAVALALDSFGKYVAIADRTAKLQALDQQGGTRWQTQAVKSLLHLAFVPEAQLLIGAAEFGLVAGYDFSGRSVWRDTPVAHIGSLSVTADGRRICLACFSDGLRTYSLEGKPKEGPSQPCRLASLSADGRRLLLADNGTGLHLFDEAGKEILTHAIDSQPVAAVLDALGNRAFIALPERSIVCLDLAT
jgi:tricorn protease-like protein